MKFKYEDNYFKYYSIFYKGVEIIFRRNKSDGESMMLFTDEMVRKLFGFDSFEKMLQNKEAQKIMHRVYKRVGKPVIITAFDNDDIDKN